MKKKSQAVQLQLKDYASEPEAMPQVILEELRDAKLKLGELTAELQRLADAQEAKIVYLPHNFKPKATDPEAMRFLISIFDEGRGQKVAAAIARLRDEAQRQGWRLGSKASLYRLAARVCGAGKEI